MLKRTRKRLRREELKNLANEMLAVNKVKVEEERELWARDNDLDPSAKELYNKGHIEDKNLKFRKLFPHDHLSQLSDSATRKVETASEGSNSEEWDPNQYVPVADYDCSDYSSEEEIKLHRNIDKQMNNIDMELIGEDALIH